MGAAVSAVGLVMGFAGSRKEAKAQKAVSKLRQKQLYLDVVRRQRDLIREDVKRQSEVRNFAGVTGVDSRDSSVKSGIGGSVLNLKEQGGYLKQDYKLSQQIFKKNAAAAAGGTLANVGSGVQSLGSIIGSLQNSPSFGG